MKNSIILLAVALFATIHTTNAQTTEKHQIRIGYGDATPLLFVDAFSSAITEAFVSGISSGLDGSSIKTKDSKSLGALELGYRYQISEHLKIGVDLDYINTKQTYESTDSKGAKSNGGSSRTKYFLFLPNAEYSYVKTPLINFYGSVSAGAMFSNTFGDNSASKPVKKNSWGFAYQVNPVGLSVGKKLSGFVELGFGYKGVAVAGLSCKF